MASKSQATVGLDATLDRRLQSRRARSLLRQITLPHVGAIDFSSNDFLSLSSSQELRTRYLDELNSCPPSQFRLGSTGSRLLDGNSAYADRLEERIAAFHGAPAGLLCNSGYDANSGLIACVPQPADIIFFDELIHASAHEGMRLSRASRTIPFAHNSVQDLRQTLEELLSLDQQIAIGTKNVFVLVESVYSMDGDICPLADIIATMDKLLPSRNGHLIVDEAHATGVFGNQGRGLVSELGLEHRVFARLHTFGKALACSGAVILCSPLVRQYLINYARPMIFTTFMSYSSLAAIKVAYDMLEYGRTAVLACHLQKLIQRFHESLQDLNVELEHATWDKPLLKIPDARPRSPIFYILTSEPRSLASYCQGEGLMLRPVVPPTVPSGTHRVRICLHAGNTEVEIERLVKVVKSWALERAKTPVSPLRARL